MGIVRDVTVAQLDDFDEIIDVRSPAEFADDHIPGAISAPVLDNEERARIGTLYKQESPFVAKKAGAALIARNIARHLETQFADRPKRWRPLVYCWRGGQRSGAMAHILAQIGWSVGKLHGGYKAYRHHVLGELDRLPPLLDFRVICGPTGSGKSRLLLALASQGSQVLDLEVLAQHRGSLLGKLPGQDQPAQRMFETRIWNELRHFDPAEPVFVEAESRKIGNLCLPDTLLERMRAGHCLTLQAPLESRIALLMEDYRHFLAEPQALMTELERLTPLQGRQRIEAWRSLVEQGDWEALVGDLLLQHYDPAYGRSTSHNFGTAPPQRLSLRDLSDTTLSEVARQLSPR
jgi:tRNA 2-selenouridine synthase